MAVIPHLRPTTWRQYVVFMVALGVLLIGLAVLTIVFKIAAEPAEYRRTAEEMLLRKRYPEAEAHAKAALREAERQMQPGDPGLVPYLLTLAKIHVAEGQDAKAEPLYQRARALREKDPVADPASLISLLNSLAEIARKGGRPADAEACYRRSIAIGDRIMGQVPADVVIALHGIGCVLVDQGKGAEAEPFLRRAAALHDEKQLAAQAEHSFRIGKEGEAENQLERGITVLDALVEQFVRIGKEDEAKKLRDRMMVVVEGLSDRYRMGSGAEEGKTLRDLGLAIVDALAEKYDKAGKEAEGKMLRERGNDIRFKGLKR